MLLWGPSDADEPSKDDEQKLVNVLVTSSGAATSAPPPSFGESRLDGLLIQ
jgi:hypothetical protein